MKKLERLDRVTIYQLVIMPLAGLTQLLTISLLAKYYSGGELNQAMQILSLSTFFVFLDFGVIFNAYYYSAKVRNAHSSDKYLLLNAAIKYSIYVCVINLLTALPVFLYIENNLGIFLFLNGLSIPGIVAMTILRGLGQDLKYLIIFNSSWPLAAVVVAVCLKFQNPQTSSPFSLAFIPLFSSVFFGFVAFIHVLSQRRIFSQQKTTAQVNASKMSLSDFVQPETTLALITLAASLQVDKFLIVFIKSSSDEVGEYLFLGLIVSSGVSFLRSIGTTLLGEQITNNNASQKKNGRLFQLSLGLAAAFLFFALLDKLLLFSPVNIDFPLIFFFAIQILLYGRLIHYQVLMNLERSLTKRLIGSILQVVITALFIVLPEAAQTPQALAMLLCTAICCNIYFCKVSLR